MTNLQVKNEYIRRINKVQDYIENNLEKSFSLEELAEVAGFSKYHFHRVFKTIINESLLQYVNRVKLEQALSFLVQAPDMSITDVALQVGYTDSAIFSRAFKQHYKISASEYRKQYSKNRKEPYKISQYNGDVAKGNKQNRVKGKVEVVLFEETSIVYVRYTGTYKSLAENYPSLLNKLFEYGAKHELCIEEVGFLAMYHSHPEFSEEHQLRTSVCMTLPKGVKAVSEGELGNMTIASGNYLVGFFDIAQEEYSDAWDFMYEEWLKDGQYRLRDSSPFEIYKNNPNEHPQHRHHVAIYLPIE